MAGGVLPPGLVLHLLVLYPALINNVAVHPLPMTTPLFDMYKSPPSALIINLCIKPFPQPRDAARREGVLKSGWKKFTTFVSLWRSKRDLLGSTIMDFMRLRNESTLTMLSVEISTESIYRSEYFCRSVTLRVSDVPSAYTGMQSSTAVLQ